MIELKDCTFCGQRPRVDEWVELDRSYPIPNEIPMMRIHCCTEFRSVEAWNHRAPLLTAAEVAALEEALRYYEAEDFPSQAQTLRNLLERNKA
jgi:hypothetical protein